MLNHIIKLASENGLKQFEILEKSSVNVANLNTPGYKAQRFEQYLRTDTQVEGVTRTDYTKGTAMVTRRELDVAIDGDGFIPVTQKDGTIAYTRDGSFAKNSEGYIVTNRGDLVGSGIQLPTHFKKLMIKPNGDVQLLLEENSTPKTIGKINLVTFTNPEGLKTIGYNKLMPTDKSGEPEMIRNHTNFKQGSLERANVNVFHEVDRILRLNASVISNLRIVRFADDIYRQSVNLRQ